jgi:FlaA1/EpsC-like NDP-sugar epimerase
MGQLREVRPETLLPLFQPEIARGGPVTVTDPEATRYFMLLSEAARLVIQGGVMGRGGEIFCLDMGEPVKVLTLSENLIPLSGPDLEPGTDIPIEIVGLRPGERLSETLVTGKEKLLSTEREMVFMVQNHHFAVDALRRDLETLRQGMNARDREAVLAQLHAMAARR